MKKIYLLLVLLLSIVLVPTNVFAKDDSNSKKVNVYFFRGEGCSHCAEAEEFFESIQDEYGDYFVIKDFEVWNSAENQSLMDKVAEARKEEVSGVPYIVIADHSWKGYSSEYGEEIKEKIKEEYSKEVSDRYDIKDYVDFGNSTSKSVASDIVTTIIIIFVVGGIATGIYFARKKTSE